MIILIAFSLCKQDRSSGNLPVWVTELVPSLGGLEPRHPKYIQINTALPPATKQRTEVLEQ